MSHVTNSETFPGAILGNGHKKVKGKSEAEQLIISANAYNRSLIEVSLDPLVTVNRDGKIN